MKTRNLLSVSFMAFALFVLTGCQDNNRQNQTPNSMGGTDSEMNSQRMQDGEMTRNAMTSNDQTSVFDIARDNDDLTNFSQNLNTQKATQTLDMGEGPYTVFAPEDAAYDELSDQDRNQANADPVSSLEYLVIEDELTEAELRSEVERTNGEYTLTTLQGNDITVALEGEEIILKDAMGNQATIVETYDDAFNGIVHVIDGVLRPMQDGQQNNNQMTDGITKNANTNKKGIRVAVEE